MPSSMAEPTPTRLEVRRRPGAAPRLLGALALSAALGACQSAASQRLTLQPRLDLTAEDYDAVLRRWTRSATIYDRVDSILFAHATFHAPEFRRAFVNTHFDVYGPGSEEASRLLLTQPEAEEQIELFLSASTSNHAWNDFHEPRSIWRITLTSDDIEPVDATVTRVKPNANLRVIYPYITDFARTYSLRFPRVGPSGRPLLSPGTRRLTLRIISALGEAEMVWRFAPLPGALPEPR